jgi:hypothetical protein
VNTTMNDAERALMARVGTEAGQWVVLHGETCYGPFNGGQSAADFIASHQDRSRYRMFPLTTPK